MSATAQETITDIGQKTVFSILAAIAGCHLLNDLLSSLLPAIYPMLKSSFQLSFAQVGLITLTYQLTASLLQPLIGHYTDLRPKPYSLPVGMGITLTGLLLLAFAQSFHMILAAAALVGSGSSVFHPESSRVARMASGGQHGLAQSLFQVGGNTGQALGPLLAALIVMPRGQSSLAWFSVVALLAIVSLTQISNWAKTHISQKRTSHALSGARRPAQSNSRATLPILVLLALLFSKFFYLASITSYFTFYLIETFHVSVRNSQVHLFVFLGAAAVGTFAGGPIGDRIGRKRVIWGSILGVLPFTLVLPYANLFWTGILTVIIGLILASASSAIIVYALELVPGKVGTVAGLFFGLSFGMAGVGAAALGRLADATSIGYVYQVCSFLPLIGLLTVLLPDLGRPVSPVGNKLTSPVAGSTATSGAGPSR